MKGPVRLLIIFALPLVLGKVLEMFLSSGPGRRIAEKSGYAELTTDEGIDMAKKYAAAGAGAIGTAATALAAKPRAVVGAVPSQKALSTAAIALDTAELLLATGALVKVVGEFLKDREKLRIKKLGAAASRSF